MLLTPQPLVVDCPSGGAKHDDNLAIAIAAQRLDDVAKFAFIPRGPAAACDGLSNVDRARCGCAARTLSACGGLAPLLRSKASGFQCQVRDRLVKPLVLLSEPRHPLHLAVPRPAVIEPLAMMVDDIVGPDRQRQNRNRMNVSARLTRPSERVVV